jgi:hypothetical protein
MDGDRERESGFESEFGDDDPFAEEAVDDGLRDRISRMSEDALGDMAHALLDNPILNQALKGALGAGERAMQAQRSAMGALNLPAASDLERLERRLRSISERVEAMEDRVDDVADEIASLRRNASKSAPSS